MHFPRHEFSLKNTFTVCPLDADGGTSWSQAHPAASIPCSIAFFLWAHSKSSTLGVHIARAHSGSFLCLPALVWNVLRRDLLKWKLSVSAKMFTSPCGGFAKEKESITWMYISINSANIVSHVNYFKCVWTDQLWRWQGIWTRLLPVACRRVPIWSGTTVRVRWEL